MKKIFVALLAMLYVSTAVFAQSDLQVLAVVKYDKDETITLKQLKKRVSTVEKQVGRKATVEEKKEVLNAMIEEKLLIQDAKKIGISIPDSYVDQSFEAQLSQTVGMPITEKQFNEYTQANFGESANDFFIEQTGLSIKETKEEIRTSLYLSNYIQYLKRDELLKIGPTDEMIRGYYEASKSSMVRNDMADMLRVAVEKGSDDNAAKVKINELRNKYIDKKITADDILKQVKSPDAGYMAQKGIVSKDMYGVQQLGMPFDQLLKLFSNDAGFVTDIVESDADYNFLVILKKYDAKLLGLSDVVIPNTTQTVYESIKASLTNEMLTKYMSETAKELANGLRNDQTVVMKKTGAELDKLLNWGE